MIPTIRITAIAICLLLARQTFAQAPAHDLCANAVTVNPVTTCGEITNQSLFEATSTGSPTTTCGATIYDVWYKFTVPTGVSSVTLTLTLPGGSNLATNTTYTEVFNASTCGAVTTLTSLGCNSITSASTVSGLTPGATYYFRVFTTVSPTTGQANKWQFDLCLSYTPPPSNDECTGSITLSNGVTNNSGTVWLATQSSGIPAGCMTGTPDDDVWYSYTTSGVNLSISLTAIGTNLSSSGARLQLFSGTCGSLASVACGTTSISTTVTSGTTYYIRVYSAGAGSIGGTASGSAFSITATTATPPANDECANATTLSSGSGSAGTVWNATTSSSIPTGCSGDPDDDVWYKITPAGVNLYVALSSIGTNLSTSGARMQLFSGTCGTLTSVACGTTWLSGGVTPGSTYYIRVYSAGTGSIGGVSSGSAFTITATSIASTTVVAGRMKEVYMQQILSPSQVLADPWEITYGPDNYLWITEAKGYKVYRMDPANGARSLVLDISQNSTFFTAPADQAFNVQFASNQNPWPQGGMAGLAIHPNFMHPTTPENFVYVSYVHSYNGGSSPNGIFFTNRLVRFTYNTSTNRLESPVALCDTLPGSNDHNSQRAIIAPVAGTNYLFYASGDMGSGQFSNISRPQKAQNISSYEGKILRFNLVPDGDANAYQQWIPNNNLDPLSAVWATGMRNNQGFAYDTTNGILYGSSHGPYSDDEINIIEANRNYGHPLVIGYVNDANYDNSSAGANTTNTNGIITSEVANAAAIGVSYKDPLFSAYAPPAGNTTTAGTIRYIYTNNPPNGTWPSEGWSGLDIYKNTVVPGWKNSLVVSSLKWGRVLRLKLGAAGTTIVPTAGADTVSYFGSTNRFRDLAFAPNGKEMFVIMDRSATTSGPSAGNPVVPACGGCVQKYTFLGYMDASGKSSIPTSIDVTAGQNNSCNTGTTITIDATNNNLWVPITGPDGNIMAEIHAAGQNLGQVTSSFYINSGTLRNKNGTFYLDRNITITPAVQPTNPVKIRLYFSKNEFDALDANALSGVSSISDLKILKNTDGCNPAISAATTLITPTFSEAHGTNGYMLQASISGFSSFYFGSSNITLPVELITFTGSLQPDQKVLLKWKTENERNASQYVIERSIDGSTFETIGTVAANGSTTTTQNYSFLDEEISRLQSLVFYYRLKMTDIDASYKYSNVIMITIVDISGNIQVIPNPVRDQMQLVVQSSQSGPTQVSIVDANGRTVQHYTEMLQPGSNTFIYPRVAELPAGVYYLRIDLEGEQITKKFSIVK